MDQTAQKSWWDPIGFPANFMTSLQVGPSHQLFGCQDFYPFILKSICTLTRKYPNESDRWSFVPWPNLLNLLPQFALLVLFWFNLIHWDLLRSNFIKVCPILSSLVQLSLIWSNWLQYCAILSSFVQNAVFAALSLPKSISCKV